jgi:cytochrome b
MGCLPGWNPCPTGGYQMKSVKVWDIFIRIFHWTLVGSIIGLYLSAEDFKSVHIRLGYFVICLVLARIIWGFFGTKYARFSNFLYSPDKIVRYLKSLFVGKPIHYIGHNPAGGLMIVVMLISLLVTTFTGLKALAVDGQGPLANSDASIIRLAFADGDEADENEEHMNKAGHHPKEQKEEFWEEIHEVMTSFMAILIVVHLGGVLVSSWRHKDNLVGAMTTGKKKANNHSI